MFACSRDDVTAASALCVDRAEDGGVVGFGTARGEVYCTLAALYSEGRKNGVSCVAYQMFGVKSLAVQ